MRTLLAIMAAMILTAGTATSQTTKKDSIKHHLTITADGKIKDTPTKAATRQADKVVQTVNGIQIYQGTRGGYYYWDTRKKTGESYKHYIEKGK